uniref:Uncharacterized protein n=1 Tax=Anguilla anguilla TaxID=7936 RepID=A0A0E9P7G1_ANGAN
MFLDLLVINSLLSIKTTVGRILDEHHLHQNK